MDSSANGDIMQVFTQERKSLFPNLITVTHLPPKKPSQGIWPWLIKTSGMRA